MAKGGTKLVIRSNTLSPNLAKIAAQYPKEAEAVLFQEGERAGVLSNPFVPKDSGTLADSFFVNQPIRTRRGIVVVLGYGGAAAAYAAAQHEGPGSPFAPPSWSDKTNLSYQTPGTGPKFFEAGLAILAATHERRIRTLLAARVSRIVLKA